MLVLTIRDDGDPNSKSPLHDARNATKAALPMVLVSILNDNDDGCFGKLCNGKTAQYCVVVISFGVKVLSQTISTGHMRSSASEIEGHMKTKEAMVLYELDGFGDFFIASGEKWLHAQGIRLLRMSIYSQMLPYQYCIP